MELSLSTHNPREIRGCEVAVRRKSSVKKWTRHKSCYENDAGHRTLGPSHEKEATIRSGVPQLMASKS
jgi:hypothetical protein